MAPFANSARLRADAGVLGCLGNHERYVQCQDYETREAAKVGIAILRHQASLVRRGNGVLNVAGVDYQSRRDGAYLVDAEKLIVPGAANHTTNVTNVTPSLNQLFAGLRYTPQNLSVTAGRDTIVYGNNGTMLHFYTNSFKNGSGNIITSGTVYLQLTEMYKAGDL